MRSSKFSSVSSGYCLWTLFLAMGLFLLIASSQSWFRSQTASVSLENFRPPVSHPSKGHGYPPVLAYWICGTRGESKRMLRLLKAIYHPRNQYLLQLDAESSQQEREDLILSVQSENVFQGFGNVNVVGKSYAVNHMGSSALAAILHAASLLLKLSTAWDWLINLSPSDYPLVSQDDFLHAITSLPRDLNFIAYASDADWRERQNMNQIVADPSLYLQRSSHLFYAVEKRTTPDAFNIYRGSPWMILTRDFMEYCIQGWDNLPRKLLMYFSNTASPLEFYFHTVLCNSPEFRNKTVRTDLRYNIMDGPTDGESPYDKMLAGEAVFARPFKEGNVALNVIDEHILNRPPTGVVPGKWCLREDTNDTQSSKIEERLCSGWGNIDAVKPGSYGIKFEYFLSRLATEGRSRDNQCHH